MKVAIVGAGPAGATAALELARAGRHEVVLLDRDPFPRMKTCGSALSPRCLGLFRELHLWQRLSGMAYGIRGCRFVAPSGAEALLCGKEGAWIIPRATFDAELAFAAERAGARFVQGFKATRLLRDGAGAVRGVSDGKQEIEADLTLLADGAHSRFSVDPRARRRIATLMAWYDGVPYTEGCLEMFFDPRVRPWYGWLFPEGGERVNVGICYDPDDPADPKEILREVIERHVGPRLRGAQQVGRYRGAPICYTEAVGPVATPGAMWIGESARLTNAATGEGIFYAMKSGQIAALLVAGVEHPSEGLYRTYAEATRQAFRLRLQAGVGFMRFVGTPAFGALSNLVTRPAVRGALAWVLTKV